MSSCICEGFMGIEENEKSFNHFSKRKIVYEPVRFPVEDKVLKQWTEMSWSDILPHLST